MNKKNHNVLDSTINAERKNVALAIASHNRSVKDPKLSRVLIVQNNVYAAMHGAIGEDRLQETCQKVLTSSCLRTGVRK